MKQYLKVLLIVIGVGIIVIWTYRFIHPPTTPQKEKPTHDLFVKNIMTEHIQLVASKYGLQTDLLIQVMADYEKKTQGYTLLFPYILGTEPNKEEPDFKNIVDVNSALDTLSQKYQMDKKLLSTVIIEIRCLEKRGTSEK
jgi:hypothetical protein